MRLQGISDIPLNETGIRQSKAASHPISQGPWQKLITSPLGRARETALLAGAHISETIENYPLLIERSFGEAEGLTYEQWRDLYPKGTHPKGSESIEQLTLRANRLLDQLAKDFLNMQVLAVSHGAMIRRILNVVSGGELPPENDRFANCSLNLISFDGVEWKVSDYNPHEIGVIR